MFGTLIVWGTDFEGFWKKYIKCYQSEVQSILATFDSFDGYDFEF